MSENSAVNDDDSNCHTLNGEASHEKTQEATEKRRGRFYPTTSSTPGVSHSRPASVDVADLDRFATNRTFPTLENLRSWTKSTYRCKKQAFMEKFANSPATVDTNLKLSIQNMQFDKSCIEKVLTNMKMTQETAVKIFEYSKNLGKMFSSFPIPRLSEDLRRASDFQKSIAKSSENLLAAIEAFSLSMRTLCFATIEDTQLTVRKLENSRLEFDACRNEIEKLKNSDPYGEELEICEREFAILQEKYLGLKSDVETKLKLLEDNKVKVMKRELQFLNQAILKYFTSTCGELQTILEANV